MGFCILSPSNHFFPLRVAFMPRKGKAKGFVYAASPGPGEYTPRRPSSTATKFAGSAAFRSSSSTGRATSYLKEMGDPGQYNPDAFMGFGSQSARSFNKMQQTGRGRFNSDTPRGEFAPRTGFFGPGAAGYNPRPEWIKEKKWLSPGFATKSQRSAWVKSKSAAPAPGRYDPHNAIQATSKRTLGGESGFRNATPRFQSKEETARIRKAPGPGAYSANNHTLAAAAKERIKSMRTYTSTRADLFRPPRVQVYV